MLSFGSRREILIGALASAAMPAAARAQQAISPEPLRQLLGQVLPGQLRAVLPGEAFQAAEFVSSLMTLEAEAKVARLPPSRLATGETPLPASLDSLYELALPRLVALIDRAEVLNPALADKAAELLARLHATQHAVPRWLASVRLPGAGEAEPMRLDPGSDEAAGLHVASPIELPAIDLPQIDLTGPAATPPPAVTKSTRFAELTGEYAALFASARLRPQHGDRLRGTLP